MNRKDMKDLIKKARQLAKPDDKLPPERTLIPATRSNSRLRTSSRPQGKAAKMVDQSATTSG
jgi:hypothetical protein